MLTLYSYFRSSAAFRVRIALGLKNLPFDLVPVHLVKDGGQQLQPAYRKLNADGLVPALVDDGNVLTQSLAIIEYLDEVHPEPKLLPGSALDRAYVRSLALEIACEIHPLNNLRVLKHLKHGLGVSEEAKDGWYKHWIVQGFTALETTLARGGRTGTFCLGDTPTLADICLVPQVFNAQRFSIDLSPYLTIQRIFDACMALPAFQQAQPKAQPDAE